MNNNSHAELNKATTDLRNGIEWFLRDYENGKASNETLLSLSYQLQYRITHYEIVLAEIQDELRKKEVTN
jgi:hypothetical protein